MRWMRARVITLSASEWFISGVHFHRNLHTLLSVLRSLAPGFHNFDFRRIFLILFLLTDLQHLLRWFSASNGIVLMRPRMLHNVLREMTSELFIWSKKLLCWLKRHTWAEILICYWDFSVLVLLEELCSVNTSMSDSQAGSPKKLPIHCDDNNWSTRTCLNRCNWFVLKFRVWPFLFWEHNHFVDILYCPELFYPGY